MMTRKEADKDKSEQLEREQFYAERAERYAREGLSEHLKRRARKGEMARALELEAMMKPRLNGEGREVLLRIEGRQSSAERVESETAITTRGVYYCKKDKHYLIYDERSESGLGETRTTIVVEPDGSARLLRSGEQTMRMRFLRGTKEITHYNTPFGRLSLGFYTNSVAFKIGRRGGWLKLNYNLDASLQEAVNMQLLVRFTFQ